MPSSPYCMIYLVRDWKRKLKLITLGSERVNIVRSPTAQTAISPSLRILKVCWNCSTILLQAGEKHKNEELMDVSGVPQKANYNVMLLNLWKIATQKRTYFVKHCHIVAVLFKPINTYVILSSSLSSLSSSSSSSSSCMHASSSSSSSSF